MIEFKVSPDLWKAIALSVGTALGGVLIWMIKRYLDKMDNHVQEQRITNTQFAVSQARQEERVEDLEERADKIDRKLEGLPNVRYRKGS